MNLGDVCVLYEPLSQREEWEFVELWKDSFIPELKARTGKWPSRNPNAHDFIFEELESRDVSCFRGAKAEEEYGKQVATEVFVGVSEPPQPVYRCRLPQVLPIKRWWSLSEPYYYVSVSEAHCAWTLLISHEDEIFFSYSKRGKQGAK